MIRNGCLAFRATTRDECKVTCKQCRVSMLELKGHLYHGNRKFRCPLCRRVKMKKPTKPKEHRPP